MEGITSDGGQAHNYTTSKLKLQAQILSHNFKFPLDQIILLYTVCVLYYNLPEDEEVTRLKTKILKHTYIQ